MKSPGLRTEKRVTASGGVHLTRLKTEKRIKIAAIRSSGSDAGEGVLSSSRSPEHTGAVDVVLRSGIEKSGRPRSADVKVCRWLLGSGVLNVIAAPGVRVAAVGHTWVGSLNKLFRPHTAQLRGVFGRFRVYGSYGIRSAGHTLPRA